ncbi:hypothetical protein F66182_14995, partial [Fusarium sp. NRRL 66182]
MAGRKRKADLSHKSSSQDAVPGDTPKQTASPIAKSIAARGNQSKATITAQIQVNGSGHSHTTNSSETASQEESASTQATKASRAQRQKVSHNTEVLQPSRSSARLKSRAQTPASEMPPKLSPQSSAGPVDVSKNTDMENENIHAPEQTLTGSSSEQISRLTPKSSDVEAFIKSDERPAPMTTRGRKRKLAASTTETSTNVDKRVKAEHTALNTFAISEVSKIEDFNTDISTNDATMPKVEEKATDPTVKTVPTESTSNSEKVQGVQDTATANQPLNDPAQTN